MSKVLFSVTIGLTRRELCVIAQTVMDRLADDYGTEVVTMAGVNQFELMDALLENKTFQRIVSEKIKQDGIYVCEDPYDYFDAYDDFIAKIPELGRLYDLVDAMDDIYQDAIKSTEVKRVEIPDGYMLVKIA